MEGPSNAPLHNEIEEIKDNVTTCINKRLAFQSPIPLWLRICKVQDSLRDVNEKAYEPVVLSIGPYHHGKAHLRKMEDIKLRYLQLLLKRRNETDVNRYVEAMREMEEKARECYADPIGLDKDTFVMMMVLDGCFIVELFIEHMQTTIKNADDRILGKDWLLRSIQRDLLLCENQLPFFVLKKLLKMIAHPDEEENFYVNARVFFWAILGVPTSSLFKPVEEYYTNFDHFLGMIFYDWCPSFAEEVCTRPFQVMTLKTAWIFKFSATELREAGIQFKRAEISFKAGINFEFESPFKIKFSNGVLEISPLTIDHHTESLFRNLIAYEQQPQQFNFKYITDYIRFMDILIDSEKDVQILRHREIIQNGLGDDKAVCTMFNKFCENLICRSEDSYYSEILIKMKKHCKQRRHERMANLRHNYFNSPWALTSVLAAAFVILLAVTQTVYTIISYHKK